VESVTIVGEVSMEMGSFIPCLRDFAIAMVSSTAFLFVIMEIQTRSTYEAYLLSLSLTVVSL
jgi:hypothetical protein